MKLKEIQQKQLELDNFLIKFDAVITYSNNKGPYIGRVTRKSVQLFVLTGKNIVDCMVNAANKSQEKSKSLGL